MAVPGYCDQVMSLHVPVAFPFEQGICLYRVFLPGPWAKTYWFTCVKPHEETRTECVLL
jgi:hypothetical protein